MIEYGHKVHTKRISTNLESFQKIAENKGLGKKDYRVFLFLACRLESEHFSKIDVDKISETLDIAKYDVKNSIENLINENIIECGSDEHVKKGYRFCYADSPTTRKKIATKATRQWE